MTVLSEFSPPPVVDRPFAPPIETVLRLPPPPSVNRTRRIDHAGSEVHRKWVENADKEILAAGGMRKFAKMPGAFEATLVLDEQHNKLDCDNAIKAVIDYARRVGLIVNDNPKHMRRVTVEWGHEPIGCRLILRSILEEA